MYSKPLLSVGIDIGTTSTHLTVSNLHLSNVSRVGEPTRLVIDRREILYQSPIHFTPLTEDDRIDSKAVVALVMREYECAGVAVPDIETGAVIVTGETARKRNADEIARELSKACGRFVVASAGANLESVLAARGSGAAECSRVESKTICNVDVGGGTSNIAVLHNGSVIFTDVLDVGGRMVQVAPIDNGLATPKDNGLAIARLSNSGQAVSQRVFGQTAKVGDKISLADLRKVAAAACTDLIERVLNASDSVHEYWFSGGVAELMRVQRTDAGRANSVSFGDLGNFLAAEVLQQLRERGLPYFIPENAIRATVIGAGHHSLQLSGSTVFVAADTLPISDLPVIRPFSGRPDAQQFLENVEKAFRLHDMRWNDRPAAILIPELGASSYHEVRGWADAIADAFRTLSGQPPLVIVCTHDIAAALGQCLRRTLPETAIVVVDGIAQDCGDYIDIGSAVASHQAIPVVIKELVFAAGQAR